MKPFRICQVIGCGNRLGKDNKSGYCWKHATQAARSWDFNPSEPHAWTVVNPDLLKKWTN